MNILGIIVGVILGYVFGSVKFFREQKQKAYSELLPPILKFGYDRTSADEVEYSKALSKLWLYANRDSALKMDKAVSIIHNPKLGNLNEAFQEAIIAMRKDIQVFSWPKLNPKDIKHLYTKVV